MSDSTKHLLDRIRDKDADAMAAYIELNRPQLLAFIDRKLGASLKRKVEPDDILQEVSRDAVRGLSDVELRDGDPFSWLCQIAHRRIIDTHRRFQPGVDAIAIRKFRWARLRPALSRVG